MRSRRDSLRHRHRISRISANKSGSASNALSPSTIPQLSHLLSQISHSGPWYALRRAPAAMPFRFREKTHRNRGWRYQRAHRSVHPPSRLLRDMRCHSLRSEDRLGGIVETVRGDGFTIECGPDSWVTEKPWAEQLARELGLADELLRSNDHAAPHLHCAKGSLTPLPDAMRMMVPTDLSAMFASPLFTEAPSRPTLRRPARAEELREAALANRGTTWMRASQHLYAATSARRLPRLLQDRCLLESLAVTSRGSAPAHYLARSSPWKRGTDRSLLGLQQRSHAPDRQSSQPCPVGSARWSIDLQQRLPTASVRLSNPVTTLDSLPPGWAVETTRGRESFDRVLIATPLDITRRLLARLPFTQAQQAATLLPSDATSGWSSHLPTEGWTKPPQRFQRDSVFWSRGPCQRPLVACLHFSHQKFHQARTGRRDASASVLREFRSRPAFVPIRQRNRNHRA